MARSDQPTSKCIRQHLYAGQNREIIQETPRRFDRLIAVAAYRAEEVRAHMQGRDIDEATALRSSEQNPFALEAADGHQWHIIVYSLWTWYVWGAARRKIVHVRLDNMRNRGVLAPDIGDHDFKLKGIIEHVALKETADCKAP